jgi:bifunctional DNA-binding transcriptional regulator/antitoxin component of YhaV-PrlF toxin-antitoxin module
MTQQRVKVADDGSVVLPAEVVRAMGLVPGNVVFLEVRPDGTLLAESSAAAWKEAQRLVLAHIPPGVSLVDELIADRRREAELE